MSQPHTLINVETGKEADLQSALVFAQAQNRMLSAVVDANEGTIAELQRMLRRLQTRSDN